MHGVQILATQIFRLILLDNQSSTNIFCKKDLVKNTKNVKTRMDLNTNAVTLSSRQQCTVPDFKNFKEVKEV